MDPMDPDPQFYFALCQLFMNYAESNFYESYFNLYSV